MKNETRVFWHPFEKIAGWKALAWGLAGMAAYTVGCYLSGREFASLLLPVVKTDYGLRSDFMWNYGLEHIVLWGIPALLFCLGGLILSRSRIRAVDVFGTVAFAQLPLAINGLSLFFSPIRFISGPGVAAFTGIVPIAIFALSVLWMLLWLFDALRVSCNLRGSKLVLWFIVSIAAGQYLTGWLIQHFSL